MKKNIKSFTSGKHKFLDKYRKITEEFQFQNQHIAMKSFFL